MVVHLSAKLPVLRRALARQHAAADMGGDLERRRFLLTIGFAAGVMLLVTAGRPSPLRALRALAPAPGRRPPGP
jgi:hypothetical protein